MKILLMVAAGIAVGLTVFLAVLVQVLVRLAPLLVMVAVIVVAVHVVRRRGRGRTHPDHAASWQPPTPAPAVPTTATSTVVGGGPSLVLDEPLLSWGPSAHPALPARPLTPTRMHRVRAGARPSSPVRGRRP